MIGRAFICVLFAVVSCCATKQISDSFEYEGQKGWIEESPLLPLLQKRELRFEMRSTANYSGFVAGWEVKDGKLYLSSFTGRRKSQERNLKWLFPDTGHPVFADWYSGKIHVSLGEVVVKKLTGHVVVTRKLVMLQVVNGKVSQSKTYAYPKNVPVINELLSKKFGRKVDITEWKK
ncbi:MAG: hypothetical protein CMO80_24980 [Verrucomicrobiales bacterium]|nr:hypothetical protein [Verrucomicrobiales bacterium]|tara:strand:+ start:3419 stop:3946 length:528 start_codon:yes stop_codon:yes gene_type:complete